MATSLVPVTVEHPQYTQTFTVRVPPAGTVSDIKHEISQTCPGHPKVEGQRLISKGRILDDGERVESLWTAPEDARVVHLAVNPLSWSTDPPNVPLVDEKASPALQAYQEMIARETELSGPVADDIPTTPPPTLPQFQTLPFISHMHHKALRALSPATPPAAPGAAGSDFAKARSKAALEAAGHSWPAIFDAEFPGPSPGGVTYDFTLVGGKPFLENLTPYTTPTPRQQHALDVLSYTFPLLTLDYSHILINHIDLADLANTANNNNNRAIPQPNFVQNLNGGAPRAEANGRNVIAVRVNMRELLTPLVLLFIRTLILLYFFSPARKPVFGILLGAYILYEAWGAVRGAIFDIDPLNGNDARGRPNDRRPRGEGANGAARPAPPPANGIPAMQNPGAAAAASLEAAIDYLAQLSLEDENRWLESDSPEPGVMYKAARFFLLLIFTIHPAFWNRRRAALRAREGRLRTEANAVEAAARQQAEAEDPGDERARQARQQIIERNERRPAWIREYIERVRRGDWVDD